MKIKYFVLCGLLFACAPYTGLHAQTAPPGQMTRRLSVQTPSSPEPVQQNVMLENVMVDVAPVTLSGDAATADGLSKAAQLAATNADNAAANAASTIASVTQATTSTKSTKALAHAMSESDEARAASAKSDAAAVRALADAKAAAAAAAGSEAAKEALNAALKDTNEAISQSSIASSIASKIAAHLNPCGKVANPPAGSPLYNYRVFRPMSGCSDDAILSFFAAPNVVSAASQVQYLYNPTQSANQINADILTATFEPGFQVVLAGTATQGSSTAATPSATQNAPATDSPSTAVAKLEQGGDFNLRVPIPIARQIRTKYDYDIKFLPNLGFTVSGLTGQNTITGTTDYLANFPLEAYFETKSLVKAGDTPSVLYLDIKAGAELVSSTLATKMGLTSNPYFFLGQASAGIQFANSVRVGFQYFIGPSQVYSVPTLSGATVPTGGGISGLHLVVSFAPPAPAAK